MKIQIELSEEEVKRIVANHMQRRFPDHDAKVESPSYAYGTYKVELVDPRVEDSKANVTPMDDGGSIVTVVRDGFEIVVGGLDIGAGEQLKQYLDDARIQVRDA